MLNAVEALMPKPSQSASKRFFKSESKRMVYADCDIMMMFWWQKYIKYLKCDEFLKKNDSKSSLCYQIINYKTLFSAHITTKTAEPKELRRLSDSYMSTDLIIIPQNGMST